MGKMHGREWESFSLEQFAQLSIDVRSTKISAFGDADLTAALQMLPDKDLIRASMDVDRLAWAVAFNVTGETQSQATGRPPSRRGIKGYRDHWSSRTLWNTVWKVLIRPFDSSAADTLVLSTLLSELARSVTCEQRRDWQPPAGQTFNLDAANSAFDELYLKERAKVTGAVGRSFKNLDSEDISDEAWVRAFGAYWSYQAQRRFLGICKISTLVISVAFKVAADAVRKTRVIAEDSKRNPGDRDAYARSLPEELADDRSLGDPAARLLFKECLGLLSPRERIVAEIVWFRGVSQRRVAEILGTSEEYISQVLKSAKAEMVSCLTFKARA